MNRRRTLKCMSDKRKEGGDNQGRIQGGAESVKSVGSRKFLGRNG